MGLFLCRLLRRQFSFFQLLLEQRAEAAGQPDERAALVRRHRAQRRGLRLRDAVDARAGKLLALRRQPHELAALVGAG